MKKHIIISAVIVLCVMVVQAQEYLVPLVANPALKNRHGTHMYEGAKTYAALKLPFLDDFSNAGVYPDSSKWADRFAFVNSYFGPYPTSVGMVTLDCLDDTGAMYPWATPTSFIADYLTSKPIRLDSVFAVTPHPMQASDSLYLSFYYQPQGLGNSPETDDSLILQFRKPSSGTWVTKWASPGMMYSDFFTLYGRTFKLVMIPILDTAYMKPDFQFRFKNYASITNNNYPSWQSNADEWDIDYVYLNYGRSKIDTTYDDITFVEAAPSMLKNYTQMPGRQYIPAELKDTFLLKESNLGSTLTNMKYKYIVNGIGVNYHDTLDGGVYDILPFITNGYHNWPYHVKPAVHFTLPDVSDDSKAFEITHMMHSNGWPETILSNDTIRYRQEFYNYYAYDNGVPELGYGLAGIDSRLAYQFTLNHPDTIGAVKMFFNQTLEPPTSIEFYVMIWSSLSPETVIYKSKLEKPVFTDSLNKFTTYYFPDTTILVSGTFWIGWKQITDDLLNIGFDMTTNSQSKIFINTTNSWQNTSFTGSLMIRPVLGSAKNAGYGVHNDSYNNFKVSLYPNPVSGDVINLVLPDKYRDSNPERNFKTEVFNYTGQKIMEVPYSPRLSLTNLQDGYYLLRLRSASLGVSSTVSFVVVR